MLDFVTINVDGEYKEWHFDSIEELREKYHKEDYTLAGNDDPVTEMEYRGIPMYVNTFDDIVKLFGIEEEPTVKYGIEISYSWGDSEDGLYGSYESKEEAFKEMCALAAKEAYIYNENFDEYRTCAVYFNAYKKTIDLHYEYVETWCYYRIRAIK